MAASPLCPKKDRLSRLLVTTHFRGHQERQGETTHPRELRHTQKERRGLRGVVGGVGARGGTLAFIAGVIGRLYSIKNPKTKFRKIKKKGSLR